MVLLFECAPPVPLCSSTGRHYSSSDVNACPLELRDFTADFELEQVKRRFLYFIIAVILELYPFWSGTMYLILPLKTILPNKFLFLKKAGWRMILSYLKPLTGPLWSLGQSPSSLEYILRPSASLTSSPTAELPATESMPQQH